ncbi:crossover junction endodeoxyribonuclease RuvC [Thermodesulforhabdus norvegica]|nr:crossover junction endodeoxyribonuclease RuvC [Thermodesulforhabdus norvegica]
MERKRIIGVDPGSLHTGYGIVESGKGGLIRVLISGTIHLSPRKPFTERLGLIFRELVKIIKEFRPCGMAIEDVFCAANPKTALKLGQARGAALLSAITEGIPVYEYSPLEIKQAVVGYGRASKNQVHRMITTLLGSHVPGDSHASDALAVALCHLNSEKLRNLSKVR